MTPTREKLIVSHELFLHIRKSGRMKTRSMTRRDTRIVSPAGRVGSLHVSPKPIAADIERTDSVRTSEGDHYVHLRHDLNSMLKEKTCRRFSRPFVIFVIVSIVQTSKKRHLPEGS